MSTIQHLELGLFGANATGICLSSAPERWTPTWESNRTLAIMAEAAGMDFHLPLARWKGHGGASDPLGTSMETLSWAAGLAAVTRKMKIFTTVHTPFFHPVIAAKQLTTIDMISGGRIALNIVSGWDQEEFEMLGLPFPDHDDRYELSKEWTEIATRIWESDELFDYRGRFFSLEKVISKPRPQRRRIPLMSAGASTAGRSFAVSHCDHLFVIIASPEQGAEVVQATREAAARINRAIQLHVAAYVVCRPTQKEAEEFHRYFAEEMADEPAVDHLMDALGIHSQSFPPEHYRQFRVRFAGGHGNYPIVGDPDHVAAELRRIRDAGFTSVAMGFLHYLEEFPYFRDEVLPRLESMGVRRPVRAA